jgi:hypothetical protein
VLTNPADPAPNILVGGGTPARDVTLIANYLYHSVPSTSLRLGYAAVNDDLTLRDNYVVGYTEVRSWKQVEARGNTFVGTDSLVTIDPPKDVAPASYTWDGNAYVSDQKKYPGLLVRQGGKSLGSGWEFWKDRAGLDGRGSFTAGKPTGTKVFVRPNRYEVGRAHVVVYNWDRATEVAVPLAGVLKAGQDYRVVSAQDFFGKPVLSGTFDRKPVRLPMRPVEPPAPVGMHKSPAPPTGPEFDVFVVLPGKS